MIARIIAWCAKNRLATLLVVGLATGWGVLSLRSTALDALPDLSDVQVIIFSEWMGRAPDLVNVTQNASTLTATSWGSVVQSYLLSHP